MSCHEAQLIAGDYCRGKLSLDEEGLFVNHVRHCKDCYNELKDFYMFEIAFRYLKERDDLGPDADVETLLKETERKQSESYSLRHIAFLGIVLFCFIIGILLVFYISSILSGGLTF